MIQVELQRLGILLAVAVGHGELWSLCILPQRHEKLAC